MYSQVVLVPEERLGFVVLTNSMTSIGSALKYVVIDRVLGGGDRDWSRDLLDRAKATRERARAGPRQDRSASD